LVNENDEFDYVIILCKCTAKCASYEQYKVKHKFIWIDREISDDEINKLVND